MYLVYIHGAEREFFLTDFMQKFLFKINPEKGRSIFRSFTENVKGHFLLLRRNAGFLHESFNEILCHASAGTTTTQDANKCPARFLSRQLGDSDTRFQGRQILALKHPE